MKKVSLAIVVLLISQLSFGQSPSPGAGWIFKESVDFKDSLLKFKVEAQNKCKPSELKGTQELSFLRNSLKNQFDLLMGRWQRLSVLSVKPMLTNNYKVSVQFFPDKKGRIKKKLVEYLGSGKKIDFSFVDQAVFYATGVSALEMILFDEQETFVETILKHQTEFCGILVNIPEHLASQQEGFEAEAKKYIDSETINDFEDDLYNSILFSLEDIKKNKMDRPVIIETSKVFNKRFESYRSKNTLNNLKNNFKAQKEILDILFVPRLVKINDEESIQMVKLINEGYGKILQDLDGFDEDIFELKAGSKDYLHFEKLRNNSVLILSIIKNQIAPKLKISIQFNGADGD